MENPYKAPTAAVRDPPSPPRSPWVAVLAGLGIDIGGGLVTGILTGIVYAVILAADGMAAEQIQATLTEPDPRSAYFVLSTMIGYAFSSLGGYVCARLVRSRERRVTGIMAAISGVLGLALGAATDLGRGLMLFLIAGQVACILLGGELGRRRNSARAGASGAATAA